HVGTLSANIHRSDSMICSPSPCSTDAASVRHPGLVLDLQDVQPEMLALAGGKALNLGAMLRAGLPVPPGLCVTTEGYREVASGAGIDFDQFQACEPERLEAVARKTREALTTAPVPEFVARGIADGYASLGENVPVAVRSSATAEDLPNASFAGQ